MPRKSKKETPEQEPAVKLAPEVLEKLVPGPMSPEEFNAMFRQLKKSLVERALDAELTPHLGCPKGEALPEGQTNHRNGMTPKTVLTDDGSVRLDIPRDRAGTFDPLLIGKHERRFAGFDDRIIAMYARGMTVREIGKHLQEMYGVEVSPQLISDVTEAVVTEVVEWQDRALEAFEAGPWTAKHPMIAPSWRKAWERVIPFFAFPPEIRRIIYTTNSIGSVHMRLRKAIKTRGHFPSDEAAVKLLWLALRNITADWGRAAKEWKAAMNQFAILFPDRFRLALV